MIEFTTPEVTESINKLIFYWPTLDLRVVADRITDAGTAELWFYHANNTGDSLLHTTKTNLLSTGTMGQIAKRMLQHSEDIPWTQVLTYISSHTMEYQRQGEPESIIEPDLENITHPGYFVEPIILKESPSVVHGDKGTNKTTLCLTLLGLVATNYTDSPTGLIPGSQTNVGLLDWESNQSLTRYTMARLVKGETTPFFRLPYLRCQQPLADDIERIANFIHQNNIHLVLIDSLGGAAGSDKFDSAGKSAALHFFAALRKLNITSLIIAQNAKGEDTNKKTIYGSTYFTYYSRNIFELKAKVDDVGEDKVHLALLHQESNYSKRYQPLGFLCSYTSTTITIESESVSLAAFLEKATYTKALLEFLKDGAKSVATIGIELELSDSRTRTLLSQLKKRSLITNLGSGMWGLLTEEE